MPEEKVSRPFGETLADIRNSYVQTAADAGPRQPHAIVIHKIPHCVCGHAHDAGNICSRCACRVAKLCNCALAAPPVPQAPAIQMQRNPQRKGTLHALRHVRTTACHAPPRCKRVEPATAPDEAMRVAEQKAFSITWDEDCAQYRVNIPRYYGGKVVRLEDVAALIREAGSERERDAFESCAKELREHYNSDWDSTVPGAEFDAEILRILRKHLG